MTALNNELSKRLSNLDDSHEELLRPFLNELASANTSTEETLAKDKFKKHLSEFVKERGDQ
ncbi:hypothetical protein [Staphylococcus equorum]|uniref:hypothetical protein n=1 Tax=Staphylococcus equorum TaxID=246432 RepID=UPI0021BE3911|nr:hypothetical protein [Staphylococcus equorum]